MLSWTAGTLTVVNSRLPVRARSANRCEISAALPSTVSTGQSEASTTSTVEPMLDGHSVQQGMSESGVQDPTSNPSNSSLSSSAGPTGSITDPAEPSILPTSLGPSLKTAIS